MHICRCALCGRRANAHGSVRRRLRDQIAGRISPAPGAADRSAVVKVELGPARIRASLTGAPDRDNAVRVWSFSELAEGSKRRLRALLLSSTTQHPGGEDVD